MYRPPTDNIYKFIALSGLLLLLMSIYLMEVNTYKIKDDVSALEIKEVEIQSKLDNITLEREAFEKENDTRNLENESFYKEQFDKLIDIKSKTAKLEVIRKQIDQRLHDVHRDLKFLKSLMILGFLISTFGFYFWYHKNSEIFGFRA